MKNRDIYKLARQLRGRIGAHYRLIGDSSIAHDEYLQARADSDQAVSTARYLVQYLPPVQADVIRAVVGVSL